MKKTISTPISAASKNTIATAVSTGASKIELFAKGLKKYVRDHYDCVEKVDNSTYMLKGVDLGAGATDFKVSITDIEQKEGKRKTLKRDLYRINPDGSERVVQFGKFKKNYLYTLMNMVIAGHPTGEKKKLVIDKEYVGKIADAVRADRSKFSFDNGVFTGAIEGIGDVKVVESEKTLKTGKKQLERKLFVDGELKLEGGQLNRIMNAFRHTGNHKSMEEILADADKAVSDLV